MTTTATTSSSSSSTSAHEQAIYASILSRVGRSELRQQSNALLVETLEQSRIAVVDATVGLQRLRELEDAVAKLRQGHSGDARSDALAHTVESTEKLQRRLRRAFGRLATPEPLRTRRAGLSSSKASARSKGDAGSEMTCVHAALKAGMQELAKFKGKPFALCVFDDVLKDLYSAVQYRGSDWDPRSDEEVLDCFLRLREKVSTILNDEYRQHRVNALKHIQKKLELE